MLTFPTQAGRRLRCSNREVIEGCAIALCAALAFAAGLSAATAAFG